MTIKLLRYHIMYYFTLLTVNFMSNRVINNYTIAVNHKSITLSIILKVSTAFRQTWLLHTTELHGTQT